jgi:hypothetical protein
VGIGVGGGTGGGTTRAMGGGGVRGDRRKEKDGAGCRRK